MASRAPVASSLRRRDRRNVLFTDFRSSGNAGDSRKLSYPSARMGLCPRPSAVTPPAERLEVLFEELAELAGQRNAIDGRIVEIVAEMDRDELCGATGCAVGGGVGGLEAGLLVGQRHDDHHRRGPARGVSALRRRACGRAGCHWIRSGSSPRAPPTAPMSITRSWPRWPRSTSCAPRSSSNRDPTPIPGPNPSARSPRPAMTSPPGGGSPCPTTRRPRSTRH